MVVAAVRAVQRQRRLVAAAVLGLQVLAAMRQAQQAQQAATVELREHLTLPRQRKQIWAAAVLPDQAMPEARAAVAAHLSWAAAVAAEVGARPRLRAITAAALEGNPARPRLMHLRAEQMRVSVHMTVAARLWALREQAGAVAVQTQQQPMQAAQVASPAAVQAAAAHPSQAAPQALAEQEARVL
jgi:hypothetical protein